MFFCKQMPPYCLFSELTRIQWPHQCRAAACSNMFGLLAWLCFFWRAGAMKDHVKTPKTNKPKTPTNETPKLPQTSLSLFKAQGPSRVEMWVLALPEIFSACTARCSSAAASPSNECREEEDCGTCRERLMVPRLAPAFSKTVRVSSSFQILKLLFNCVQREKVKTSRILKIKS